ncbi:DUF559 domain-containing protein [Nocardia sp. NBC_01503]|uniref:DUF559 domain-containing protein n=1 Tax=Nocardia sp. NBC_01503 TaxID=2975997 RepID=UPI003FA6055A|nr:DUF559 domain-containing protein [Nocardia sp. NBC_01503]
MGWRAWQVGVEYDGAQHWTDSAQRAKDIDRLAILESLGWHVVRVSASLPYRRPDIVLGRVRSVLGSRGVRFDA